MGTAKMSGSRCVVALAIALGAMSIAACGGTAGGQSAGPPKHGGTMTIAQTGEVTELDPLKNTGDSLNVSAQIMEPLYQMTTNEKIVPWLVSSATSSANLRQWTFHLRPGVYFSNGQPLTAADVVFSLDQVRKSANWEFIFNAISGVRATSPSTVEVTTKQSEPALLAELAIPAAAMFPKNFGGMSEAAFSQHPIGTGPFRLASWARGQALTLERNPHYWQHERPYLDKVVFKGVPEESSRVAQLRSGAVDVIQAPTPAQVNELNRTRGIKVGEYSLGSFDDLDLNTRNPLFRDPRAREAVDIAIDRNAIVKVALSGHAEAAGSNFPPTQLYFDRNIKPPKHEPARARKLLAEAVAATGAPPKFTLVYFGSRPESRAAAEIMQQDFEEVGFKVVLQPLDESALVEAFNTGAYDALAIGGSDEIVDPSEEVGYYVGTKGYHSGANIQQIEKIGKEAAHEVDPARRRQLYYEIQELVAKQNFLLQLDNSPFIWAMHDNVVGFGMNSADIPYLVDAGFGG